jgi:hypothetical protein
MKGFMLEPKIKPCEADTARSISYCMTTSVYEKQRLSRLDDNYRLM